MTSMRARVLNMSGVLVLCSAIAASTATSTTAGPANRTGTTTANRTAASAAARLTAARAAASLASPQQLQAAVARHAAGYRVMSHPGALTDAERARVNRYWTAARMASAQPPGPVQVVAVPAAVPGWAAGAAMAGPNPISVRGKATAAGWPGGGTVSRTTGKVFFTMDAQDYVCSAAVVTSANSNVVITAAHCVKDGNGSWAGNWEFVPGFGYGDRRPYGTWTASHFFVPGQWSHGRDDNDDVAFVTLSPKQVSGRTMDIGQVVGGQNIAFGGPSAHAYAFGYPAEPPYDGTVLYYCRGRTKPDPYHASKDAGLRCGLNAGSSGGPWLSGFDPATGTGTITSISSFKYETDAATLYGPHLGPVAKALFDRAQHG